MLIVRAELVAPHPVRVDLLMPEVVERPEFGVARIGVGLGHLLYESDEPSHRVGEVSRVRLTVAVSYRASAFLASTRRSSLIALPALPGRPTGAAVVVVVREPRDRDRVAHRTPPAARRAVATSRRMPTTVARTLLPPTS